MLCNGIWTGRGRRNDLAPGLEGVNGESNGRHMDGKMHLPVFCVTLQHQWVFGLANLSDIVVLDFLDILLGLDPIIFGEGTLVALLFYGQNLEQRMLGSINGS